MMQCGLSFKESVVKGLRVMWQLAAVIPYMYSGLSIRFGSISLVFDLECDQFMQIIVRDNNVDQALRALKKKLQREGVYREMKLRRHYEKPSEKRAREKAAAVRRARKMDRKRMERDGVK
jgi:small subunit ribosomal protein S21